MTYEGIVMARFKDFGEGTTFNKDPLTFKLYDEDFECYPALQGKVLLDFIAQSGSENGSDMADTIVTFFGKSLKPESYERFMALVEDPDRVVSIETLGEITAWLVGEYSDRPTEQPESSASGQ
jgi:hypothetical protein